MLRELHIENFAIVDRLRVPFGPGLNVLTGETGAGKTVLLEAVALLAGGKSDRPPVREGAEEAVLQGLFDLSSASSFPFPEMLDADRMLLLERRIPRSGRARAEVNGRLVPMERLRAIGTALVDFHGQQERENLLDGALQRAYLDAFAGAGEERRRFRAALEALRGARAALLSAEERTQSAREREDFLRWQAREIDEARLRPGEKEELEGTVRVLKEAERLREAIHFVREALREGDRSAVDLLGEAADRAGRFGEEADAAAAAEACRRALVEIEEALGAIDRLAKRIDAPPEAIDRAIARLEAIAALERKHRKDVGEILAYRETIRGEVALIDGGEEALGELRAEEARCSAEAASAATALTAARKKNARLLAEAIEKGVRPLALPAARFGVEVEPEEDEAGEIAIGKKRFRAGRDGIDRVEYLFAANKGEPLLALRRVASGGEISRVMLAVKRVLADAAPAPTAVFDEIDAGVGGDVGERIGAALREVASKRQVLCVTHLPAIAGLADRHLRVEKIARGGRTVIAARPLEGDERVEEVVRMLGGEARRAVSVPHAEAILNAGKKKR
ncbi:MAG: DNA repair protein RecN [Candidatus Latescibacterota bacterium]|nr:MAG: DNA repair protein RecN [Candidatus Latescibacterota bacterium]